MQVDHQQVAPGDTARPAGVLDIVRTKRGSADLAGVRVLDLACRTGAFAAAFHEAGADATGVEGRQENLDMAYPGPRYIHDDVRNLNPVSHGSHDVVLCLGILYHLDAADAVALLRAMWSVTHFATQTGIAVIDTHLGAPLDAVAVDGHTFHGNWYGEPPGLWSSIGNPRSFWFTDDSLDDAARLAGWTTVERHAGIRWQGEPAGRTWRVLS